MISPMPRPKKTEMQRKAMRARILDAAYEILQELGPQGISARAIADRLGMAHMALFTYFQNQPSILRALSERELASIQTRQLVFEERAKREDIRQVIRAALAFYPGLEKENPNVYRLVWVMPADNRDDPEEARLRQQSNVQHLARLIQQGIERGVFEYRDPFLAAAVVFGMVNTPLILFHNGQITSLDLRDRLVEEMLDAALHYLKREANFTKGKWN